VTAGKVFFSTFFVNNYRIFLDGSLFKLGLSSLDYVIVICGVILMATVSYLHGKGSVREMIYRRPYPVRFIIYYGLFLIVLLMGAYGIGYDASQFIYNQF
jgi:hypothetical protein